MTEKKARQRVTQEQVHIAYDTAKFIHDNPAQKTKQQGASELHERYKINKGTANDFIRGFHHLMAGSVFKRALSEYAMRHFLTGIQQDYGLSRLQQALSALKKHIDYREEGDLDTGRKPVPQGAMRRVYDDYSKPTRPTQR